MIPKDNITLDSETQEWTEKQWEEYFESNQPLPSDTYDGGFWEEQ